MNAPKNDRARARPALRTGSRVLFVVLVCLLAALPAAGLALTTGAVTQTRTGALPRPDVLGLLCRKNAPDTAEGAGRAAGGVVRSVPVACGLRAALPANRRTVHGGTALSCRAG
ncbi:hypothetical protein HTV80_06650 [Streptomyces sp. Vc74B-19]|uniref:hypothetical protein n=1 Tax=unclassified Streptomyces TaxID=2593676 RepID=UPI001BFC9C2D|nr:MULTISPECIES: hypothetical protein [unclassified Streptomyces]MBT3162787.1 hypothetical protein [Streptomyces sp. Vc74B-19]MCO4695188.1 hypothetical protein [Streptomyces sp. RO-S4]MDU0300272.1 hypothetical protein [Streptomyces sp. PAL114]